MEAGANSNTWHGRLVRLRMLALSSDEVDPRRMQGAQPRQSLYHLLPLDDQQSSDDDAIFVIEDRSGVIIGEIAINNTGRSTGTLNYVISIREDQRGRGYAGEAISLALRYYFEHLHYQKAMVILYDFEDSGIRLHEKLGFMCEARLRRMTVVNDQLVDLLVYGITAEEFTAGPFVKILSGA